jgi:dimethylhistidine N-methyltransferase
MTTGSLMPLVDLVPHRDNLVEDVIEGLAGDPKRLPSKYFYDRRGSELFDAICELPEYYPTRTELAIMRNHRVSMADQIGGNACVIEIGSGSGLKTDLLLRSLDKPRAYIPIDISRDHLLASADHLARRYPGIEVNPVCADFLQPLELPSSIPECDNYVIYFPGSTLGNLTVEESHTLLQNLADLLRETKAEGARAGLMLGVDLQKDIAVLEAAYNDSRGVTAEFNRNILHHINRELGGEIPVDAFDHHAPYNSVENRIEMRLVANRPVRITVAERQFAIAQGESILTEFSHKYEIRDLERRLAAAGWSLRQKWTDSQDYFVVTYCALL